MYRASPNPIIVLGLFIHDDEASFRELNNRGKGVAIRAGDD